MYQEIDSSRIVVLLSNVPSFICFTSNEYVEVNINIPVKELAYYDENSTSWKIEKGNYIIYIGNSSREISREIKIKII